MRKLSNLLIQFVPVHSSVSQPCFWFLTAMILRMSIAIKPSAMMSCVAPAMYCACKKLWMASPSMMMVTMRHILNP